MVAMSMASARRISEVLNETSDLKNPEHPTMKVEDGSIEFRHVDFAYKKDSDEPVLEDINLKIRSVRRSESSEEQEVPRRVWLT